MAMSMKKPSFFSRRVTKGATLGAALLFFVLGIFFWGSFNTAMEATNTLEFCISCHEMEDNVYQEYVPTIHHSNRSGVRASCSDCHVPKPWIHKMARKVQASNEVLHKILGTIDTPEKFDKKRLHLAKNVWKTMKATDSRECRNCHHFDSMNPEFQKPRARKQHLNAFKTGQTCIDCHKGIAHKNIRDQLTDEEIEELEKPNPDFIREVPKMYLDGLKKIEQQEKAEEEKAQALKVKAKAKKKAAKEKAEVETQKRIDAAVSAALSTATTSTPASKTVDTKAAKATQVTPPSATSKKPTPAPAPVATPSASAKSSADWSKVSGRDITVFYPGQSSMEWILTGKDHGGARPFVKMGDRCTTCHEKEVAKMGQKIVTGEKLEPAETLIPNKRGSIAVTVQATHDAENLYMRFEWENSEHTPAPFVEGGKMDSENEMKLAIMFAGAKVKYADQAGCWGTCHHDLNSMPHHPEGQNVVKYITESRTKIEVKGRRKKMRGGWDKRKTEEEIKTELASNHFMDISRYKSGTKTSEDGYVLGDRVMEGSQNTEFTATLDGDNWVVEMKRKLKSDKAGDITMELDKLYNFGFAIHDDHTSARFHHVSLGYKLGFDNDKAEVNATKQ
ncbi:MAG: NapC/NirT family cytochrome c [Thiotrichaceae bacterium]|nr:NapC/NirT family cytochrome c [Thiotrichaceae bacterium]